MRGEGGGRRVRHTRERRGPRRGASDVARSRDRTRARARGGGRVRHTRERRGPGRGASAVARSRDRTLRLAPCLGLVLLPLGLQSCLGLRLRLRNALLARGLLRLPGGALRGGLAGGPSLALGVASRVLGALLGGGGGVPADARELARERRRHGVARARRVHAEEVRLSAQEAEYDVCAIDRRGDGRRSGCARSGERASARQDTGGGHAKGSGWGSGWV